MKRFLLAWTLLLVGIVCISFSERTSAFWQSRDSNYNVSISNGVCSQATTFLARTSLTGSDATNYTNLICGLVTDGVITGDLSTTGCGSLLDALYIFATTNTTTANLNICGTSFGITANNTPTFTADRGYTGNGSNTNLDTGINPSTTPGLDFSQNSASLFAWSNTSGTDAACFAGNHNNQLNIIPQYTDSNFYGAINNSLNDSVASPGATGFFLANRAGVSTVRYERNGSSILTSTSTSSAPFSSDVLFLQCDIGNSSRQVSAGGMGASLNSTLSGNLYTRLRTYMTAVGVP